MMNLKKVKESISTQQASHLMINEVSNLTKTIQVFMLVAHTVKLSPLFAFWLSLRQVVESKA